jgi:hypothetical protein
MPILPPYYNKWDYSGGSERDYALRNLDRQYDGARRAIYRSYDDRAYLYPTNPIYYADVDYGTKSSYTYVYKYLNSATGETMSTESKQFVIIGTSGAAQQPAKHASLSEAEKEANRLAKSKPGEEFTIYETKKSYKVEEKPVTVKLFV